MQLQGSNFVSSSVVNWNNSALTTIFFNAGLLEAWVPTANLAAPGTPTITVTSPAPGGGASNGVSFAVQGFSLGTPSGGSTVTITPGNNAIYTLTLNSVGLSGTASFACSGLPTYASCSFSPNILNLPGNGSATDTLTISTSQTSSVVELRRNNLFLYAGVWAIFLWVKPLARRRTIHRSGSAYKAIWTVIMATVVGSFVACGGCGTSPTTSNQSVIHTVASGSYAVAVTATSGSASTSIPLTLTVN